MADVVASSDGYVTASGTFDTLREALDAVLPAIATSEKPLYFRDGDTGDLNGEMRWLPACDVEGAPVRGIRIDEEAIVEMAASLNSNPRAVPINGGPTPSGLLPSQPHGDIVDSSTLANGRAQWGVVVDEGTTTKLYLYAEVMPHIAREIDVGRLAEGSVCFDWQTTEETPEGPVPRGVEFISHAFTNDPAVKTLEPANSVRGAIRIHPLTGAMRAARTKGTATMAKKISIRAGLVTILDATAKKAGKDVASVRGPALDKLTAVAAMLGISIDDEMSADAWESPTSRAVSVIKDAAMEEKILDAVIGTPAAATAKRAARAALPGMDAAQMDSWMADMLKEGQRLTGKADATPAEVLDLLKAGADGSLAGAGGGAAGAGDTQGQVDGGNMTANETQRAARAEMNGLKSNLQALEARVSTQDKELSAFRARELRANVEKQIVEAARIAKRVAPSGEGRENALEDAVAIANESARGRYIEGYVARLAPAAMVMDDEGTEESRGGTQRDADGGALTSDEAIEIELKALRAEGKVKGEQALRGAALAQARAKHPAAFGRKR